jgi:drug/metabolite transporter (DMT)-like permease
MNRFRVGLVLLIIGVALLVVGGLTYTTQEKTKIGPIAIEHPAEHTIPYSPIAGVLLALTGGGLMLTGRRKSHAE